MYKHVIAFKQQRSTAWARMKVGLHVFLCQSLLLSTTILNDTIYIDVSLCSEKMWASITRLTIYFSQKNPTKIRL